MQHQSIQKNIDPTGDMLDSPHSLGQLWGVSVGPGDPELITVKGLRRLQRSPIVAFPAGRHGAPGMAERIVQPWLRPEQQRLPLQFPYVRDEAALAEAWQRAAAQVVAYLEAGQDVCFVSEGDVSLFSTFSYLAHFVRRSLALAHGSVEIQAVQTIPGVCSPLAAAAVSGLPLTLQDQKLAVLPALYGLSEGSGQSDEAPKTSGASGASELEQALGWADVVVLMKIASVYKKVWPILKAHNLLEDSYVIEQATGAAQQVYRGLGDRPDLKLPYFSILVIYVKPLFSQVSLVSQAALGSSPQPWRGRQL